LKKIGHHFCWLTSKDENVTISAFLKHLKDARGFQPPYGMSDDSDAQQADKRQLYPGK
jgi:hypothetical protein